jgi:hypothetical protein
MRGYRVVCAEDVFVDHVGGGTFRKLDPEEYGRIFESNRKRYEEKWGEPWPDRCLPRDARGPRLFERRASGGTGAAGRGASGFRSMSTAQEEVATIAPLARIAELVEDRELWGRLAAQGRAHIEIAHGRDAVRARLLAVIEKVMARPAGAGRPPGRRDPMLPRGLRKLVARCRPVARRVREASLRRAELAAFSNSFISRDSHDG